MSNLSAVRPGWRRVLGLSLGALLFFPGLWMLMVLIKPAQADRPQVATPLPMLHAPAASLLAESHPSQALRQRCELAMVKGLCRVMKSDAPAEAARRVFIAGTGEVDAALYAELRRQGDAMCGDVARRCEADWEGRACQIARSLYPVTSAAAP